MISFLSIIAVGFFLGMRHATDPDHVIAVTTIVTNQRRFSRAALIGAFWGVGHTLTILVVGAGIILFNLVIPARIGLSMELSVGMMLVVLGVMNITSFLRSMPVQASHAHGVEPLVHAHAHSHGEYVHHHTHVHAAQAQQRGGLAWMDRVFGGLGVYQYMRPLVVGIVHGLAGSAAVALLVLTTIRDTRWAIAYLLIFGIGTIGGMMLITMSLASAFRWFGGERFSRILGMASGVLSLAFGLFVTYQICFGNGLFTAHPHWTPK
jgi:high-affinity nickel-transport protein